MLANPSNTMVGEGKAEKSIDAINSTNRENLRRLLREQIERVEAGQDPINVVRDPDANHRIPTNAWNTILSPVEAALHQGEDA